MAAGSTYTPIATTTLGSAQASVTFNSFSGYTDLYLVIKCGQSISSYLRVYFNGDTASNYSGTFMTGTGSAAESIRYSNNALYWIGGAVNPNTSAADYQHNINIMNYSNSTTYKTVVHRYGRVGSGTGAGVGLWRNTAAITSITIDCVDSASANYVAGSTFTLYGIAAA